MTGALNRWENAKIAKYYKRKNRMFTDKLLSMDFADIDKTETHDLLSNIRQVENWSGWGFHTQVGRYTQIWFRVSSAYWAP